MGRAFEVRKVKMAKTGSAKGRVYSKYGKLIYTAAKQNPNPDSNERLASVIKAAKRAECTKDVIDRAIAKAKSNEVVNFKYVTYEGFISKEAHIIIECSTDNMNRTAPEIKAAFTKSESKLGMPGSVSVYFDHLSVVIVKGLSENKAFELMIENNVDIERVEIQGDNCLIYAIPQLLNKIVNSLEGYEILMSEIKYISHETVQLSNDEKIKYDKLMKGLDDCGDIDDIFTNLEC